MDIFSHGLWGALAAKLINNKLLARGEARGVLRKPLDPLLAALWGIFPDFVAFAPIFVLVAAGNLAGDPTAPHLPRPSETEPFAPDTILIYRLTSFLYSVTHSAIVFTVVFLGIWLARRYAHPRGDRWGLVEWEMGAWLLHILFDVPTHSYRFYPTPVLWPISEWRFDGIPWHAPWFMILNYAILALGFLWVRRSRK